jgi:ribosomal-protein-alanine N-acetyltransferase
MSAPTPQESPRTAVEIRPMAEDLSRIVEIENESYSVPWSPATFRGLLRRRDADTVVAIADGMIVGYAAFWCVLDQGELGNVAVTTAWRGRGIAGLLIEEVLRRADRRGVREVFLEVRPTNATARQLYERFGFVQVGRRRNYYQRPVEDALVMRRPVRLDLNPGQNT